MFLREIKVRRKSGKVYSWWVVVKTYWDKEKKKVRHRVIHNLGRLTEKEVKTIKNLLSLKEIPKDSFFTYWNDIKVKSSYEYLPIMILDKIFHLWGLDKVLDNWTEEKVSYSITSEILVINRAISPMSDLRVCDWYRETILPKLFKISPELVNPTRIYRTLDKLFEKEREIQQHISEKIKLLGVDEFSLIFYDITSSYFEGDCCRLAEYGLSRDKRRDKKQLLLGLGVTKEGFCFYWEVLPGSIHDSLTVCQAVESFKKQVKREFIVVMDKGMISNENIEFLEKNKLFYITTVAKHRIRKLSDFPSDLLKEIGEKIEKEENIKEIMKDYTYFTYFSDRAYYRELNQIGGRRYILCFNPEKLLEERKQRQEKIKSICEYLEKWNEELKKARYKKDEKKIEKEIYAYLKKRKAENYFKIEVERNKINYKINHEKLQKIKLTDGIWCILTNLPKEKDSYFLITSYLKRRKVEEAFHYLKGFIEIRPFYHHKESRVKAHILVCILAYLLQVTLEYLLKKNGYKFTYQEFIQKVRNIKCVEVEIKSRKEKNIKLTEIPEEINEILRSLKMDQISEENFIKNLI